MAALDKVCDLLPSTLESEVSCGHCRVLESCMM